MIDVSIVIVCMNNLINLYPCLESIRKYTHKITYETFVVAYLFSKENLEKVKKDFPWVTFIESNEIRGFSENNNLALRKAKGKYCFVLNDDTEMNMPVIDMLVSTIESLPERTAIVSPVTIGKDGVVQVSGRAPITWWNCSLFIQKIYYRLIGKKYCNKEGVFKSYNIIGAAFLIKTQLFENEGWFNEKFFFCPEDIALSTSLNKKGYFCYVNSEIKIVHTEGMSGKSLSMIKTATKPAGDKGSLLFLSNNNYVLYLLLGCTFWIENFAKFIYHFTRAFFYQKPNYYQILSISEINTCKSIFSCMTPKEIFIKFYNRIK